jgi:predicted metal-dependent phosphoesterase TrpH
MGTKKLKVDLHLHTREDPLDSIKYSAEELIDNACDKGFDIISITNHNAITYNGYLADYAKERGILLIPGIEVSVNNKHVLVINADESCTDIRTFDDIRRHKDKNNLVIAPHPFFPSHISLNSKLSKYHDLFNAIEYSYFYTKNINFNKRGVEKAKEYNLALLGTSDTHRLWQLGKTYSLIEADKDPEAIIDAIRKHKVEVVTEPLNFGQMVTVGLRFLLDLNNNLISSS